MSENKKDKIAYIDILEDKIVDLSLQLRNTKKQLQNIQIENSEQLKKIVHNLKNPIGAAYSFSEMIAETGSDLSAEKLTKYVNVIKSSTLFSINTLNSIAELSRLRSPDFELNYTKTNYCNFLNTIIDSFSAEALKRNISIVKFFSEEDIFINIDSFELEKAIKSVIDNALRYSSNNSKIQVQVKRSEGVIETKIIDEGIGIEKENLPLIFNDFFVANTYSNNSEKCIGLGLTKAKIIFNAHNGIIVVKSKPKKGVTVKVTLPS